MIRLEMKNFNIILMEKPLKYQLHHHQKKKKKKGKYEYLTGEEILPFNQKKKIIEQAKFTYFPLGKGFEIQIKTVEDQQIMKLRL